jgi:hypothetical protein
MLFLVFKLSYPMHIHKAVSKMQRDLKKKVTKTIGKNCTLMATTVSEGATRISKLVPVKVSSQI